MQRYLSEVSNRTGDRQYARACYCLANIFNSLGKYDVSAEYARKAFDIAKQMNYQDLIDSTRVLYGITKAHKTLKYLNQNVEMSSRKTVNNLMKWKFEAKPEQGEKMLANTQSDIDYDEDEFCKIAKYNIWK